jgi:serine/threonine-protein kinase
MAARRTGLAIREKLVNANPNVTDFQYELSHDHQMMGWALKRVGKLTDALAACERAIAILQRLADADPEVFKWQSDLALDLSYVGSLASEVGRTAEGVTSLRRAVSIWTRLSSRMPHDLYNLSCTHAKLASLASAQGSGMTAAEGRAEADLSMERLRQAVAAGYRKITFLRTDRDLDPLRSRPDFQLLMMDLEFPDEPFARELSGTRE